MLRSPFTQARLFAEHAKAGLGENPNRGSVRDKVGPVLPRPGAGQSPVGQSAQRIGNGVGGLTKDLHKRGCVHSTEP